MSQTCQVLPSGRWWQAGNLCKRKATTTLHDVHLCTYHTHQVEAGIPQYVRDTFHVLSSDGVRYDQDKERRHHEYLAQYRGAHKL